MYSIKKEVKIIYDGAVLKVREALKNEGFGILTEIDVKATLKKKLNADFDNYLILGACNPPLAHKALQAEPDLGLMLPCNVIVYEKEGKTFVAAIRPTIQMQKIGNPQLALIAAQVEEKLKNVIANV
ncbi:DUF302 domain-containing protein [Candidatus Woesearchaeota archaeon]|nr:DUF302 domain-containing protein [Candidatus Woesearchaeota archaeon]